MNLKFSSLVLIFASNSLFQRKVISYCNKKVYQSKAVGCAKDDTTQRRLSHFDTIFMIKEQRQSKLVKPGQQLMDVLNSPFQKLQKFSKSAKTSSKCRNFKMT